MNRQVPAHPATARGLISDPAGRWLIVRPTGREWWHLPGGLIEQDESPAEACQREVREEIGLDLLPGRLLVVGWNPPRRPGSRARFTFVFSMGRHNPEAVAARIRLQPTEVDAWQFARPDDARSLLHPDSAGRLTRMGEEIYTEGPRCPVPAVPVARLPSRRESNSGP
ncbi:NUDIX hydrolase [Plantactinospora mayteni]|uniref:Nudix hydrolase domain-containing protein n=1 Tax=Plantactinospora mayteni TaxID=566021 RepID=A0ABQ4EY82_9ACTN|nr:NUDIX hydrolase [Plantactinospora mayteni]GIG99608.1 hypothetical protein Pma05_61810 [Plantactinospora mayteni]